MAGAQAREAERAQAPQAVQVAAERTAVRRDEHAALAEHRVAREGGVAGDEHEVVGGMPGHVQDRERPEAVAVGQDDVGGVAHRPDRRVAERRPQRPDACDVIRMVVRERDAARTAALGSPRR